MPGMKPVTIIFTVLFAVLCCFCGLADVVKTTDGAVLCGKVVKISKGTVVMQTSYAGELKIKQDCIVSIDTKTPLKVRHQGQVPVVKTIAANTEPGVISSAWPEGSRDPEGRNWIVSVGADLAGKSGNSDEYNIGSKFDAKLQGPVDRLRLYGEQHYSQSNKERSVDSSKLGAGYTRYMSQRWGAFLREEFERDAMTSLNARFTTACGVTHAFVKKDHALVEARLGLSYRFEDFSDKKDDGFFGLDAGMLVNWKFAPWAEFDTQVSYLPEFDDFSNYLFSHDTGLNLPLSYAENAWKLRLGVSQTYDANALAGRKKLDTTYYTRLLYEWN